MFNLDELYKAVQSEKHNIEPFGDIYIKLINTEELDSLMKKPVHEQIAFCLLDEKGNKHFDGDGVLDVKNKMKLQHQDELINLIMKVNRFGVTIEQSIKE